MVPKERMWVFVKIKLNMTSRGDTPVLLRLYDGVSQYLGKTNGLGDGERSYNSAKNEYKIVLLYYNEHHIIIC